MKPKSKYAKMSHAVIKFNYGKKPMKFEVIHNLDEYGLDIEGAFVNWSVRFEGKPSLLDFCRYVESKNPGILVCVPKDRKEVTA